MKRVVLYFIGFLLMSVSLTSCEGLFETCKICKSVTYDDATGNVANESSETEYCGLNLIAIEEMEPAKLLGKTTVWECR